MPVAAKFSKRFYDWFGHELTDELVSYLNQIDSSYRSELRELNELNFSRFDSKMEQRLAQLDAKLEQRVALLDAKLEQRTAELRAEFTAGLAQLETKLIRWMFVFWAGTTLPILGLMLVLLRG